ncbi:hypothetical protein [Aneurinibacillus tyrosinisolvens]|uniref:hypothetical protein n=1 Tax=Aneurinibacillus tyrosinisolvens TaxID=1443435 RepID=UPI000B2D348D|nr:hypothetical protein [Aneurinibacillus tyrosinisolvens]
MKKNLKKWIGVPLALSLTMGSATAVLASYGKFPWGAQIERPANGWTITPAGKQVQLGDRPYGTAMSRMEIRCCSAIMDNLSILLLPLTVRADR